MIFTARARTLPTYEAACTVKVRRLGAQIARTEARHGTTRRRLVDETQALRGLVELGARLDAQRATIDDEARHERARGAMLAFDAGKVADLVIHEQNHLSWVLRRHVTAAAIRHAG